MKVLVTFAEVAAVADNYEIENGVIEEEFLEYDLNEWDEYALEAAVLLRESDIATEVVTVTIGPERTEETIHMALAKGADRAIRIWDDSLADGALDDVSTRAALIAPVVQEEKPELVFSGVQAADDGYAATGVSLARTLDFQWAAVVNGFTIDGNSVQVRRELEGGIVEITDVSLPAVLTIQTGINDPRYASLRGLQEARDQEIAVRSPADLGVDGDRLVPGVKRGAFSEPEPRGETEYVDGDPDEQAAVVAAYLRDDGVVSHE